LLVLFVTALVLPIGKIYQSYRQSSLWLLLQRITASWGMVLAALLLIGFAAKVTSRFSRIDLAAWAITTWGLLLLSHVGGRQLLRWHRIHGGNTRSVVFWGSPRQAIALHRQFREKPYLGLRLIAWFASPGGSPMLLPEGMPPCGGCLTEMRQWLDVHDVDQIHFSYTSDKDLPMDDVIRFFGDTCRPVYYIPSWTAPSMRLHVEPIGNAFAIGIWSDGATPLDRQLKRGFDLVVSVLALLLLSPLLLLIAALVALTSPGPVLFRQHRYGLDGRRFSVFKFRSMTVTEDGATPGLRQARRDDPRVTPLGRLLRRWSLDELPQLINVLLGDMSLVGPRPHAVEHNEQYRRLIPGYMQRHLFKPGITGLAQVEGWRGETADLQSMARRVDADLRYQREWSLSLDIGILIRTLLHLRSPNAY
jgi:putative colanic acid biosynthesis UDP-glucose lipid carrier transferase